MFAVYLTSITVVNPVNFEPSFQNAVQDIHPTQVENLLKHAQFKHHQSLGIHYFMAWIRSEHVKLFKSRRHVTEDAFMGLSK